MSSLDGRVRLFDRRRRLAAGCPTCGGRTVQLVEPGAEFPSWLDASSCCRACGAGVKLIDRECWDLL